MSWVGFEPPPRLKQALYLQAIMAGLLKPLWNWPQDQACFSVHRDSLIFVQRLKCTNLFFFETVIVLWKPVFISLRPIHWKKLSLVSKTDSRMPKPREIIHLRKKKNIRKILNSSKLNFYYLYYICENVKEGDDSTTSRGCENAGAVRGESERKKFECGMKQKIRKRMVRNVM